MLPTNENDQVPFSPDQPHPSTSGQFEEAIHESYQHQANLTIEYDDDYKDSSEALPLYYQDVLTKSLVTPPKVAELPKDPRKWTPQQVQIWLKEFVNRNFPLEPHRFCCDGAVLCRLPLVSLLRLAPRSGHLLYFDIRQRLQRLQGQY